MKMLCIYIIYRMSDRCSGSGAWLGVSSGQSDPVMNYGMTEVMAAGKYFRQAPK